MTWINNTTGTWLNLDKVRLLFVEQAADGKWAIFAEFDNDVRYLIELFDTEKEAQSCLYGVMGGDLIFGSKIIVGNV